MPQRFRSAPLPSRAGVRGGGDGDRVFPREDRGGHVQAPPVAVPELRHHDRAGQGRLPALLRPDGGHQHWRAPGLPRPREMGPALSSGENKLHYLTMQWMHSKRMGIVSLTIYFCCDWRNSNKYFSRLALSMMTSSRRCQAGAGRGLSPRETAASSRIVLTGNPRIRRESSGRGRSHFICSTVHLHFKFLGFNFDMIYIVASQLCFG